MIRRMSSRESRASPPPETSHDRGTMSYSAAISSRQSWSRAVSDAERYRRRQKEEKKQLFIDPESMKAKVRENLTKQKYNVKDYYKEKGIWQAIATSYYFEILTLFIITLNSVWIAIDTDMNKEEMLVRAHPVFQIGEHFFCSFFVFEWMSRFLAFNRKRDGLRDAWFIFDSGLVLTMVSETWVMTAFTLATGNTSGGGAGNTSVLRIARLLRLTRMARMARLLRAMPELMILVKGMLTASRSVLFTLLLLFILTYVFAIALTQLLADTDVGEIHFSSVPRSMFTLWIHGTLLDEINILQRQIGKESWICTAIFFVFVLLASLTVMNMLIGVLCEVVQTVAATEKEEMLVSYVNMKLHDVVHLLDQDGDMKISKSEFTRILESAEACRCLEDVGVDVVGLVDSVDAIFEDASTPGDKQEVELTFEKFMDIVLKLRGTNNATVKDMVDLRKYLRDTILQTHSEIQDLHDSLQKEMQRMRATFYAQMQCGVTISSPKLDVRQAKSNPAPLSLDVMDSDGQLHMQHLPTPGGPFMDSPALQALHHNGRLATNGHREIQSPDPMCRGLTPWVSDPSKESATSMVPNEFTPPKLLPHELTGGRSTACDTLLWESSSVNTENAPVPDDEIEATPRFHPTPILPPSSAEYCSRFIVCSPFPRNGDSASTEPSEESRGRRWRRNPSSESDTVVDTDAWSLRRNTPSLRPVSHNGYAGHNPRVGAAENPAQRHVPNKGDAGNVLDALGLDEVNLTVSASSPR
mmetsp:Transcript_52606/g.125647  ORF Transcript_52606/g.125647 Transcript_52606/m.125647 type:complete len:753 (+) Transcript_52606:112-2370(+)